MTGSRNVSGFELLPHPDRPMTRRGKIGDLQGLTLFVTRAATIEYQGLTRVQFETARKSLTERLLSADPDPQVEGCYLFRTEGPSFSGWVRAYTKRDGNLLVVPKIVALEE